MTESLSCVCGVFSWSTTRISPKAGGRLDSFQPLDQDGFAYQPSTAKLKIGEWGDAMHNSVEQIAKVRLAAAE
jgi:hypothetical protein